MKTNNRLPYYILAILVFVALIWRAANPPKPPIPGPMGTMPTWDSMTKVGDMGPSAVNPSGTMWAGAWNQKTKDGRIRSAVWIIDFEKKDARSCELKSGAPVSALSWADDTTVRAVQPLLSSPVALVDAATGRKKSSASLKTDVQDVVSWPNGSTSLVAELGEKKGQARFALLAGSGELTGKEASIELPSGAKAAHWGAVDPESGLFVFAIAQGDIGGNDTYYFADSKTGDARTAFVSKDMPGRLEGMWVSPAGILVVVAERDKLHRMKYDPAVGKLEDVKPGDKIDLASWPGAPKSMMFVTYSGGYDLSLETGKTKKLFDLTKLDKFNGYWREQVQDGRLYPRRDGNYTSVSLLAKAVDIRVITKDGASDRNNALLPRR